MISSKRLFDTSLSVRRVALLVLGAGCLALSACGNDDGSGTPDGGGDACVQANFTALYDDLFHSVRCNTSGCHAAPTTSELIMSGDKATVYAALVNAASTEPTAVQASRVVPNSPDDSFLWIKVSTASPPGPSGRMPTGGRLSDCDQAAIKTWIEAGAMNN